MWFCYEFDAVIPADEACACTFLCVLRIYLSFPDANNAFASFISLAI